MGQELNLAPDGHRALEQKSRRAAVTVHVSAFACWMMSTVLINADQSSYLTDEETASH